MITFLPYADFEKTAKCLDYRRLGKQRVEAWQIYVAGKYLVECKTTRVVPNPSINRWVNHPAVRMWYLHPGALCQYGLAMCDEWINRGYKDQMSERFLQILGRYSYGQDIPLPHWLGNQDFHISHQANLLRKNYHYYSYYFNAKSPELRDFATMPYIWPGR